MMQSWFPGLRTNAGPSSSRSRSCRKKHQELVYQGPQDQGNLSYSESFQLGCHSKVSDRRMLGACFGHWDYPTSVKTWNGNQWTLFHHSFISM